MDTGKANFVIIAFVFPLPGAEHLNTCRIGNQNSLLRCRAPKYIVDLNCSFEEFEQIFIFEFNSVFNKYF